MPWLRTAPWQRDAGSPRRVRGVDGLSRRTQRLPDPRAPPRRSASTRLSAAALLRAARLRRTMAAPSFQGARPCTSTQRPVGLRRLGEAHPLLGSAWCWRCCWPCQWRGRPPPPNGPRHRAGPGAPARRRCRGGTGSDRHRGRHFRREPWPPANRLGRGDRSRRVDPHDRLLLLEAETIEVVTQDDRRLPARQVAYDLATGFGLIRPLVPLGDIEPVPLAGVRLKPGEPLLAAVGGSSGTEVASRGWWRHGLSRAIGNTTSRRCMFTSPPIANHSGASLFNRNGELVGIGSLFVPRRVGRSALPGNMFVPVDLLRPVLAEMQSPGAPGQHPALARPVVVERGGHVQIVRVDRWGPALEAGLQPGDVVLAIDGSRSTRWRRSTSSSGSARRPMPRSSSRCARGWRCAGSRSTPSTGWTRCASPRASRPNVRRTSAQDPEHRPVGCACQRRRPAKSSKA